MPPAASAPGSRAGSATGATPAGPPIAAVFRSRSVAIRILVFALVSAAGAAYLALRERNWAQAILHDIGRLRPGSVLLAAAAVAVQIACAGSRFWIMLPHERGSWLTVLRAFTLVEIVNQVGPPRAGEAVKVVTLSRAARTAPLTMPQVTGAIIAERLVDATLMVVLTVAAAVMLGLDTHTTSIASSLGRRWPTGVAIAVLLGFFVAVVWKMRARLVRTRAFVREALAGLAILRKPGRVLAGAACSIGAWTAEVVAIRILCTALGFPIAFVSAFVAVLLLNLGSAVPISILTSSAVRSPIMRLYFLRMYEAIASSKRVPPTRSEVETTIPPRAMTAISLVPPPMSMIIAPDGPEIGTFAPIAAAIGSSMR